MRDVLGRKLFQPIAHFFQKGVFFLYQTFLAPRARSEDNQRREYILDILLFGMVLLTGILSGLIIYDLLIKGPTYQGVNVPPFVLFFITFASLYILSRKGYYRVAAYIFLSLYFIGVTYSMFVWGPDLPVVLIAYSLFIVISSILVSTRFGFLMTGAVMLTIFVVGYLQASDIIPVVSQWRDRPFRIFRDGFVYTLLLFLIGIVSWLSNRETENSLARARASEAALTLERNSLEVKVAERTAELKKIQLEEMSRMYRFVEFGKLASGIFHDLVNPLSALALHIRNMNRASPQETELAELALKKAIADTGRMEQVIASFRRHVHYQESKENFDIAQEISYVVQLFRHKALLQNVTLESGGVASLPFFGDPLKFQQMVSNLVSNAIDAYEDFAATDRRVIVNLSVEGKEVLLTVQDFGKGIAPEYIEKIFEPFFTTKGVEKGTGIGLSTTKHLVEQELSGSITVASQLGKGTVFTIHFSV